MASPPFGSPSTDLGPGLHPRTSTALRALACATATILVMFPPCVLAGNSSEVPRPGSPGRLEPDGGSLLVEYYESFLHDRDTESFRQRVSARYTEGMLARLVESGQLSTRRAAVLALGLFGTIASNADVARALRDPDPTVRDLAGNALWALWTRADSPANNAWLGKVQLLIRQERLGDAVNLATRLIARAPNFAEAYNQRAIAHYLQGHFQASADDCQRVLERNPYHFGALAGLARCQLHLDQRHEALRTFRRALRLQPFSEDLREAISILETEDE